MSVLSACRGTCAVLAGFLAAGCSSGTDHILQNDALELRVHSSAEHSVGGIELTTIRDVAANRNWLTTPSPLFELSADGAVWSSQSDLVIDSVAERGTEALTVNAHTNNGPRQEALRIELRIQMESGRGLARIDGTVRNPNQDWIGPFTLGDHDPGPLPTFPLDAHIAVVPPRNAVEEILVAGFDGILYGSEEQNDGPWSAPRPLQDVSVQAFRDRFAPGVPIAAVRRNDHQRDAFAIDRNGTLLTVFRLDGGWWSPPIAIRTGIGRKFPSGGSVAALSVNEQSDPPAAALPRQNEVAVFAISTEGQILGSREVNDGAFSPALPINASPLRLPPLAQLAAVKRNQTQQDLFVVDGQGRLLTTFHQRGAALWSDFIPLSEPSPRLRPSSALAAVRGSGNDVHAFVVGQCADIDNRLGCVYETHERSDGAWSSLAPITPPIQLPRWRRECRPESFHATLHRRGDPAGPPADLTNALCDPADDCLQQWAHVEPAQSGFRNGPQPRAEHELSDSR